MNLLSYLEGELLEYQTGGAYYAISALCVVCSGIAIAAAVRGVRNGHKEIAPQRKGAVVTAIAVLFVVTISAIFIAEHRFIQDRYTSFSMAQNLTVDPLTFMFGFGILGAAVAIGCSIAFGNGIVVSGRHPVVKQIVGLTCAVAVGIGSVIMVEEYHEIRKYQDETTRVMFVYQEVYLQKEISVVEQPTTWQHADSAKRLLKIPANYGGLEGLTNAALEERRKKLLVLLRWRLSETKSRSLEYETQGKIGGKRVPWAQDY